MLRSFEAQPPYGDTGIQQNTLTDPPSTVKPAFQKTGNGQPSTAA
jgi:hypothetical protein